MPFLPFTLLLVSFLFLLSLLFLQGTSRWPDIWKTLPRQRVAGAILAFLCLLWAANYALPLLEGGAAGFQPVIKILVPLLTILAFFHLNFLFARALGGILVLAMNQLLHLAFVVQLPGRPLFSALCYLVVIAGLVCLVAPWRLRDLLEKTKTSHAWRYGASLTTALIACVFLVLMIGGVIG